jgi:hypothetical protein
LPDLLTGLLHSGSRAPPTPQSAQPVPVTRGNLLVLIGLGTAILISGFPQVRPTLLLVFPTLAAIAGTADIFTTEELSSCLPLIKAWESVKRTVKPRSASSVDATWLALCAGLGECDQRKTNQAKRNRGLAHPLLHPPMGQCPNVASASSMKSAFRGRTCAGSGACRAPWVRISRQFSLASSLTGEPCRLRRGRRTDQTAGVSKPNTTPSARASSASITGSLTRPAGDRPSHPICCRQPRI